MSMHPTLKDRKFKSQGRGIGEKQKKAHPGQAYASARKRGHTSKQELSRLRTFAFGRLSSNRVEEEKDKKPFSKFFP